MANSKSKQRHSDDMDRLIDSHRLLNERQSVYIRPVIGKNGEKLFVTHSVDGIPLSLDVTYEAALARANMNDQTTQALH